MLFNRDHMSDYVKTRYKMAKAGDAASALYLGLAYRDGDGCDKDIDKGNYWVKLSAEKGYADAMAIYAADLISGDNNVSEDYGLAFSYAKKAADGNSGFGCFLMGNFYAYGEQCEKSQAKALEYYLKGAELGEELNFYPSGKYLMKGEECDNDYEKARLYLEKAAEANEKDALPYLVDIFTHEKYGYVDRKKAYKYGEMLAATGNEKVMSYLKKHEDDFVKADKKREKERMRRQQEEFDRKEKEHKERQRQAEEKRREKIKAEQDSRIDTRREAMKIIEEYDLEKDSFFTHEFSEISKDEMILDVTEYRFLSDPKCNPICKKVQYFDKAGNQYSLITRDDSIYYRCNPEVEKMLAKPAIDEKDRGYVRRYALFLAIIEGYIEFAVPILVRLRNEGDLYASMALGALFYQRQFTGGVKYDVSVIKEILDPAHDGLSERQFLAYNEFTKRW